MTKLNFNNNEWLSLQQKYRDVLIKKLRLEIIKLQEQIKELIKEK